MRSGDVIGGKFRIEERLGGGGYGDVYRATWSVGGMALGEVAIKEFRGEVNAREIALLLRLSHPNVIALRGVEEHECRVCLVMEYGEGGSAAELLRAYPEGVPWDRVRSIMHDVASGLAYLHGQGIVHRDVKPDNVVFAGGVAKLCDMGLAKVMEGNAASHTGRGTLAYVAPELYASAPKATPACDVYALGILAYELLAARLPYGVEQGAIAAGTMSPAPVELPTGLSSTATALFAGCLAKSPEARWTPRQVIEQLDRPEYEAGEVAVFAGTRFRYVPPGRFTMGSPQSEPGRDSDEVEHEVTLTRGLWLEETPVTQAEYERVVGSNPSGFKGADRPVERVSWFDAVAFCNAASLAQGLEEAYVINGTDVRWKGLACLGYRLPTEAEWEYACRAGTTGARYGELDAIAWYDENAGGETHHPGQKLPNPWGLSDMLGNVSEWCWDRYGSDPGGAATDPVGPASGADRVRRGGMWFSYARFARAAFRYGDSPGLRSRDLGFRPARSVP